MPRAQALQTLLDDPPRFVTAMMVLQALAFVAVSGLAIWLSLQAGLQWGSGMLLSPPGRRVVTSGRSGPRQSTGDAGAGSYGAQTQ